jgi:hypothetical protein
MSARLVSDLEWQFLRGLPDHATNSRSTQISGYRVVCSCRTVTVCDEAAVLDRHTGWTLAEVSVRQERHGEHDSVTVTIAEGFRSASYDLPGFIRSDVRRMTSERNIADGRSAASPMQARPRGAYLLAHG